MPVLWTKYQHHFGAKRILFPSFAPTVGGGTGRAMQCVRVDLPIRRNKPNKLPQQQRMRRCVLARGQSNGLSCLTLRSRFLGSITSQHLLPLYQPFSSSLRAASSRRLGRRREGSSSNDEEKDVDTAPSREISPYVKPSAAEEEALSAIQMQSTERSEGIFPYKVYVS